MKAVPLTSRVAILLLRKREEAIAWKYFVFSSPSIANLILLRCCQKAILSLIDRCKAVIIIFRRRNSKLFSCLDSSMQSRKEIVAFAFCSRTWKGLKPLRHLVRACRVFLSAKTRLAAAFELFWAAAQEACTSWAQFG